MPLACPKHIINMNQIMTGTNIMKNNDLTLHISNNGTKIIFQFVII